MILSLSSRFSKWSYLIHITLYIMAGCVLQSASENVVTFASKDTQSLPCAINDDTTVVTWTEQVEEHPPVIVLQYVVATDLTNKSSKAKYANFDCTILPGSFLNLVIMDVEENDGGTYECTTEGDVLLPIVYEVTVEVLGNVVIKFSSQEVDILIVTVGDSFDLTCYATRTRSVDYLSLTWDPHLYDKAITVGPDGNYTEYSKRSTYTVVKGVNYITCELTGYAMQKEIDTELISDTVYLNVRFAPECSMNAENVKSDCREIILTCDCEGEPRIITEYSFFNDGNLINESSMNTITINVVYGTTSEFTCSATNDVGPGSVSSANIHVCEKRTSSTIPSTTLFTTDAEPSCNYTGLIVACSLEAVIIVALGLLVIYFMTRDVLGYRTKSDYGSTNQMYAVSK